jgi:protein CWC15
MNRPTFHAAVASKPAFGGFRGHGQSAKDIASHTQLKFRQTGQSTEDEMRTREHDLKAELKQREQEQVDLKEKSKLGQDASNARSKDTLEKGPKLLLKFEPEVDLEAVKRKYDDSDAVVAGSDDEFESSDESDDDDDDDDEDDELELQRELERIKAERAAAQARKEQEEKELEERLNRENALRGNPLVDLEGTVGTSKVCI